MTLIRTAVRAGSIVILALLAIGVFQGNQRLAFAEIQDPSDLASKIICKVYGDLNAVGSPLPHLNAGDCPAPPPVPQCADGIDNDGDGLIDNADPGCSGSDDNDETNSSVPAQCADGTDNDSDGFSDTNDPNCHTDGNPLNASSYDPTRSESGSLPVCWNNLDDDGDGLKDFPADLGCSSPLDADESNTALPGAENTLALCSDEIDNDADGAIDLADPDCGSFQAKLVVVKIVINDNAGTSTVSSFSLHIATTSPGMAETIGVASGATTTVSIGTWTVGEIQKSGYAATFGGDCNASGQVTLATGETKTCTITNNDIAPAAMLACADGIDNDGDGLIDSADPGCSDSSDNDEANIANGDESEEDSTETTAGSGGNGGGGGGGSGGNGPVTGSFGLVDGSAGGVVLGASTTTALSVATSTVTDINESCNRFLTAFIRSGRKNDETQVRRLQTILRDYEGATIEVNGVYDAATLAAVHAFQSKYASEILTPWGIEESTGFVYLTTRKKINEIYCRSLVQFPLTDTERQIIEKTRSTITVTTDSSKPNPTVKLSPATTLKGEDGSAKATSSQGAGTMPDEGRANFWTRILEAIRGKTQR